MADYSFLKKIYPKTVTKEQFRIICHIGKAAAKYYLDNGMIACVVSPKKTRRYKIKINDIIKFLEDRDLNTEKYFLPNHYNNPFLPMNQRRPKKLPDSGLYTNVYKLKPIKEVPDYNKYLQEQFREYPDMMTTSQLRQLTGHSKDAISSWCRDKKVRYVIQGITYYIQKQSVISFLCERECNSYSK